VNTQRSLRRHLAIGVAAVAVLMFIVFGWGTLSEISGAVIAPGKLVVDSNVKKVQHPTGGVVGTLNVKDGDRVKKGDVVVRLDETQARTSLAIARYRLGDGSSARKKRLIMVVGSTNKRAASARTLEAPAAPSNSAAKNRQQPSGTPIRSSESWPNARRSMSLKNWLERRSRSCPHPSGCRTSTSDLTPDWPRPSTARGVSRCSWERRATAVTRGNSRTRRATA